MTPEQKSVSLETAKRLEKMGYPQDTQWWWCLFGEQWMLCLSPISSAKNVAAPDAQEIGELLPVLRYVWSGRLWNILYGEAGYEQLWAHENEAEARAACWLWLRKEKLL